MWKKFVIALMAFIGLTASVNQCFAGETDLLVQKLVEKGVLTAGEARELLIETKEEIKKENARGTNELVPAWVQTTKLKGDFRLRYENRDDKSTSSSVTHDDNRVRIRTRLGVEAKPNDQMKVGVGIATGTSSDPRSTNVTLGNNSSDTTGNQPASFKEITLDYGYGQYAPFNWLTLTGGKFKNPLWQPNDLLWDTDINPEGLAAQLTYKLSDRLTLFANNMYFIMGYNRTAKNAVPAMIAMQPGFEYSITRGIGLKAAVAYYKFTNVRDHSKFTKQSTNRVNASNNYVYNYDALNPSVELGIKDVMGLPYLAVFGDYVYNHSLPSSVNGRDGYDIGLKFGHEKVSGSGQWQGKALYGQLGREAWLDVLPDSDRYSGKTNMKSYEASLEYGLGKNTSLALDYYWAVSRTPNAAGNVGQNQTIQLDWNLKF